MPRVKATIVLPYMLKLKNGMYPAGQPGQELEVGEPEFPPSLAPRTIISVTTDQRRFPRLGK
jgi:hypothetical protein